MKTLSFCICWGILFQSISVCLQAQTASRAPGQVEHMWDAKVTIGDAFVLGKSKYGIRVVIPITGGTFEGPGISGEVLPLGED